MPLGAIRIIDLTSSMPFLQYVPGASLATRWPSLVSAFDNRYLTGLIKVKADVYEDHQYPKMPCLHHHADGSLFLDGFLDDEISRWMSCHLEEIRREQSLVLCWRGRERLELELNVNLAHQCSDAMNAQITCWVGKLCIKAAVLADLTSNRLSPLSRQEIN